MQKASNATAMQRRRGVPLACAMAIGAVGVLSTSPARAHFYLVSPTSWVTQNTGSGAPEKLAPCGNEPATAPDGVPSGMITGLSANADGTTSVTITIHEVVPHAGWYRVSLVPGPSSTQTTATLPDPTTPATSCAAAIETTPTLPVVADNVFRHTAAFTQPQSVQIKLPATVTCSQASPCTLQVVEVMNDGMHQPPGCFYHHCANLSISTAADGGGSSSGASSDASLVDDAAEASSASGAASGSSGSGASGGLSGSGDAASLSGSGASGGSGTPSGSGTPIGSGGSSGSGTSSGASGPAGSGTSGASGATTDAGDGGGNMGPGGCAIARRGTPAFTLLAGLAAVSMLVRRRRSRR